MAANNKKTNNKNVCFLSCEEAMRLSFVDSFLETHIRGQINGSESKRKEVKAPLIGSVSCTLIFFFFRSKRSVFVFCCNRLALVWFHHYFISHFSFFPSAFSFKLVDVTLSCRENRSKTVSLKFSVTPKRSHITEMASQAKVSPAHRLSETPHVQVQTLICCSSPLHSSSIQTAL